MRGEMIDPPSTATSRVDRRNAARLLTEALATPPEDASADDWLSDAPAPEPARRFGRFELLEELSRGGMGLVYRARQLGAGRIVALKLILPHHLGTPELVARFRGEAEAAATLDHPHILPVYEVGEHQGQPFFSMKLAEGDSLARRARPLPPREAAKLVAQVARAVHHAHQRGILHRDLKPGNILLDAAGQPFVADFGLAKWLGRSSDLTVSQAMLGTPNYIAPEQARGASADLTTAADTYALGAVLFDLLTGRPPFVGDSLLETLRAVQEDAPPAPTALRPEVPRDLEIICLKCLEKDPAARYASAEALAQDLENYLAGRPIHARPLGPAAQALRWSRRNPVIAGLACALLVALALVSIVSTVAAMRVSSARDRALAAEKKATSLLRESYVAQARASRRTGAAGQRFDSLSALTRAAQIAPGADLRDEAAATLALCDVQLDQLLPAVRTRPTAPIAYDPASGRIAVEAEPGLIELRPADGRGESIRFGQAGHSAVQFFTPFAGDGRFLVSRHVGGAARVWDVAARRLVREWPGRPTGGLSPLFAFDAALAADGRTLALGRPAGGLTFHDLGAEGAEIGHWESPLVVAAVAWSPGSTRLAVVTRGNNLLRLLPHGGNGAVLELPHPATVVHCAWSPDGAWLAAACRDSMVYVWDTISGQLRQTLRGHRDGANFVQFHPQAPLLASTSRDKTVRLWDYRVGLPLAVHAAEGAEPNLRFTRDGTRLFSGTFEVQPRLLRIASDAIWTPLRLPAPGQGEVAGLFCAFQYSPDGEFLALASRESIRLLDAATGRELAALTFDPGQEKAVAFDPRDGSLYVSSRGSGTSRRPILREGNTVRLGEPQAVDGEAGFLLSAVRGDGATLVLTSRSAGQVRVLFPAEPKRTPLAVAHPEVWQAALSPDGRWLLTSSTGTSGKPEAPRIWSLADGTMVRELPGIGPSGMGAFPPDSRRLAANGDKLTGLLEVDGWRPGPRLPEKAEKVGTFPCYSPDGKLLAIYLVDRIQILDAATAAPLVVVEPPVAIGGLARLAFHPNNHTLAAMGPDGAVHVWDLAQLRRELREIGLDW